MVFPGFSLYNKKSCIVDTDRKQLPGGQVFCDGRTTLFYEKGKDGKFALRIALNAFLRDEFRQTGKWADIAGSDGMKLKKDLILRQIAGQYMVMPVGRLSQICQLLHISSSAAFIWKVMEKGEFTEDSLVEEALKEYTDVTDEVLRRDIHKFIQLLDDNYMLDSGKPEPIMGMTKIRMTEKEQKRLQEQGKNG